MTHLQRRHYIRSVLRGTLIAFLVLLLDKDFVLTRLEHVFYDLRAAHCQRYRPVPAEQLMHLDIDDTALKGIGKWPWPPETVAALLDEVRLAQPKVVAMDILFDQQAQLPLGLEPDDSAAARPAASSSAAPSPADQLAASVKRLGCVLLPISVSFDAGRSTGPLDAPLTELLTVNPELTEAECVQRLGAGATARLSPVDLENSYLAVRPLAIFQRIQQELEKDSTLDLQKMNRRLLPHDDPLIAGSVLRRLVQEQYDLAMRVRELKRFSLPPADPPLPVVRAVDEIMPLLVLCRATDHSGFVNYIPEGVEGAVRAVPLVIEDQGRLLPQMALASACAAMDVDVKSLRLTPDAVTIPRPGQAEIRIPLGERETNVGRVGMLMDVPVFGPKNEPLSMYDVDGSDRRTKHVSMYAVYQAAISSIRVRDDEKAIDNAIYNLLVIQDDRKAAEEFDRTAHHGAEQMKLARANLARVSVAIKSLVGSTDPEDIKSLKLYETNRAQLQDLLKQTDDLRVQLDALRANLREKLGGRTIFIGGTATGIGDVYPTALHNACLGVIIHGAVFNAIMTGKMWRRSSDRINWALTLGTGLLVMGFVTLLTPFRAFLATLLLVGGYLLINGYLLFDKWNLIVDAAGPTVAGGLVWGGLTLTNIITEKLERARIERRFRSYVDPALVDFVVQNPKQSRLEGLTREMTMGFTDIESFTALTEKLKEKAIPLVAEYMAEMIPVIRAYNGFVAKLMGDGIYFFYGAPEPTSSHAIDAVETMLGMRKALAAFNAKLAKRGMSPIEMRAGVNSGVVIVGDAGTPEASDYTAMGEATNLAARLESGNKPFGTHSMIAQRTLELIGDRFLVRPIAKLQVIGTTGGVQVYEPLARREEATEQQRTIAQITTAAVTAFQESRFADSLAEWSRLEAIMGEDKLIKLYRRLCAEYLKSPPENFDGVVTLKEK